MSMLVFPGSTIEGKGFVGSCMMTVFGKYGGMVSDDVSLNITHSRRYLFNTIPETRIISQAFLYELYELHKNALQVSLFDT